MRGRFRDQGGLFSYISPEAGMPPLHPPRQMREFVRTGAEGTQRQLRKSFIRVTPIDPAGAIHLVNLIAYHLIRIPKLVVAEANSVKTPDTTWFEPTRTQLPLCIRQCYDLDAV